MAASKKNEILLESGTNELEIIEFTISGNHFGINVAKILEIKNYMKVTPMPNSNPFVEGIFKPRDNIITVIDLAAYLGLEKQEPTPRDIFIITNFNKVQTAFHVHTVVSIHRISWTDIEKPNAAIYGGEEGLATGIARFEDRLITIIDFEKILADINPETSIQLSEISAMGERKRSSQPLLIAEDSQMLSKMIKESLLHAGYVNLTMTANGKEAWDILTSYKEEGNALDHIKLIITDIEMPQMDGHRLLKLIRSDEVYSDMPVIIFSSLINEEMRVKGQSLGATEQITKPEIGNLVSLIDKHILP